MAPVIGVLSSYTLESMEGPLAPTVVGLVQGLSQHGLFLEKDYQLTISHAHSLADHEAAVRKWLDTGVDMFFSGGTPTCAVLQRVLKETGRSVPVVYYGAHPINGKNEVALEQCLGSNTVCVRIELPLTYTHRNFRLLRRLFPRLRTVHIPFARNTAFCYPEMAERYDRFVQAKGPHAWLSGDEVGYSSLRDLCWLIDAEYREYPLQSATGLREALQSIPGRAPHEPIQDVIVAFNDTYHVEGSPWILLDYSRQAQVPVVWVNNASMVPAGAVADFCNPFMRVARRAARYVAGFLRGQWEVGQRTLEWDHDTHFSLNRARLLQLGVSPEIIEDSARFFHEVLG